MADIVIGSGPSGIAAVKARLALGRAVILLDGGKTLEPEHAAPRDALAGTVPAAWEASDVARYKAGQYNASPGQIRKFSSDFAMEPAAVTFAEAGPVALRASRAVGGLSNLWGTAVLPYAARDMAGWPITAQDLAPHYRAVLGFLPVSARRDALADLLPDGLPEAPSLLTPSPQAQVLLARAVTRADKLAAQGLRIGAARQAVRDDCRHCGMCLHGCPTGAMWSAADTLRDMLGDPRLDHRPGQIVRAIGETDTGVEVHLSDGRRVTGDRVFLAAGVLETARILLASNGFDADSLTLRESQHGFLPALQIRPNRRRPDRLPHHTLPQMFVEMSDEAISPHLVHGQVYTWNDFYARDLGQTYGAKLPFIAPVWPVLARRLIVTQLFLHSDHCARITLRRAADGRLQAQVRLPEDTHARLQSAGRKLARGLRYLGLAGLPFATRLGAPGSSFHVGASLPMSEIPDARRSDRLGRPAGASRLHVVDASVLPAIAATTITLPVMANAYRIATEAPA
ncbi:GMC oxidoreductase [Fluviibacterium sp. DFM31]|uniref:GMC oxidoreductase n=1 Tax=Meridianimarinicoccus marinus TaxID=3231483 RepID=A0ABV3L9F7_9RHOB